MPVIISPSSTATGVGVTRQRYRRLIAEQIGYWLETTATTTVSAGDTTRVILGDELRDDEEGYQPWGEPWLYVRDGAQANTQRRVVGQPGVGWHGPTGAVTVSRPFSAAVVAGSVIEVTSPLPAKTHLGVKGINTLVDEALARIRVSARVEITGNGTNEYSLAEIPVTDGDQIRGLFDTTWGDPLLSPEQSGYPFRVVSDGVDHTLVTGYLYSAADTIYLDVLVPADRLIYDGANWSFVTVPGLTSDAYQAAAPERWVLAYGCAKAFEYLQMWTEQDERLSESARTRRIGRLITQQAKWARAAARIKWLAEPRALPRRHDALVGVSSPYGWV